MSGHWLLRLSTWKWWLLALLARGMLFAVMLQEHGFHFSLYGWGIEGGDTGSYFEPVDSWLAGHGYQPDLRMPGYGVVYALFRQITTEPGSGVLILAAQLALSAMACVVLMRLTATLGAGRYAQLAVFWLFALSPRQALFDAALLTESFCTSALVFAAANLVAHIKAPSVRYVLFAGAWLAWAIFLRPVYIGLFAPLLLFAWWPLRDRPWRAFQHALMLALPFIVTDAAWTVRNWRVHDAFHPLSNGYFYPAMERSPVIALVRYLQAYGGNVYHWDEHADIRWFNMREGPEGRAGRLKDLDVEPPSCAYGPRCDRDSLLLLADNMAEWLDTLHATRSRAEITAEALARSERLVRYMREDRPWVFWCWSRVRLLGLQFGKAGMGGLFEQYLRGDPPYAPLISAWDTAWYWIIIPAGFVGAVFIALRWRRYSAGFLLMAGIILYGVLIHPIAARLCEGRYVVPVYPFLLLGTVALTIQLIGPRSAKS